MKRNDLLFRDGNTSKIRVYVLMAGVVLLLLLVGLISHKSKYPGYESRIIVSKKNVLYYSHGVEEKDSKKIVDALRLNQELAVSGNGDILLQSIKSTYVLKWPLSKRSLLSDTSFIHKYSVLEWKMNSSYLLSKPIRFKFIDLHRTMEFNLPDLPRKSIDDYPQVNSLIEKHIGFVHTLYCAPDIPDNDIEKVEMTFERFKNYFPDERELNVLLLKEKTGYHLKLFEEPEKLYSPDYINHLKNTVEYLQATGIEKPIRFSLINQELFMEKVVL